MDKSLKPTAHISANVASNYINPQSLVFKQLNEWIIYIRFSLRVTMNVYQRDQLNKKNQFFIVQISQFTLKFNLGLININS